MEKSIEKIPTHLLGYIINGDSTGLTEQEVNKVDSLFRELGVVIVQRFRSEAEKEIVSPPSAEEDWQPYFSYYPWIGSLGCEVIDCTVIYRNP